MLEHRKLFSMKDPTKSVLNESVLMKISENLLDGGNFLRCQDGILFFWEPIPCQLVLENHESEISKGGKPIAWICHTALNFMVIIDGSTFKTE